MKLILHFDDIVDPNVEYKATPIIPTTPIPPTKPKEYQRTGKTYLAADPNLKMNNADVRLSIKKFREYGEIPEFRGMFIMSGFKDRDGIIQLFAHKRPEKTNHRFSLVNDTWVESDFKVIDHNNKEVTDFMVNGVYFDKRNGWPYLMCNVDKDIWIASHPTHADDFSVFKLWKKVFSKEDGATDALHSIHFSTEFNRFVVYGRKRNVKDWPNDTNPEMFDRRGIRVLAATTPDGPWVEHYPIDPARVVKTYENDTLKRDFYSFYVFDYEGNVMGSAFTYYKNSDRQVPDRPDRTTGTGPLQPTLWFSDNQLDWKCVDIDRTLVDLSRFERRTPIEYNQPYEPEVGQLNWNVTIDQGNEVWGLMCNTINEHYSPWDGQPPHETWLMKMPKDRFASYQATVEEGMWEVFDVVVPKDADDMFVNFAGRCAVTIDSPTGMKVSDDFTGDHIQRSLDLSGIVQANRGKTVTVRVYIEGDIYAFGFLK